jgi:hypothetical protein
MSQCPVLGGSIFLISLIAALLVILRVTCTKFYPTRQCKGSNLVYHVMLSKPTLLFAINLVGIIVDKLILCHKPHFLMIQLLIAFLGN